MWKTHVGRKASQVSLFLYTILLVLSVFILIYNANTLYLNCFLTFGRGFFFQVFIYCYVSVAEYLFYNQTKHAFFAYGCFNFYIQLLMVFSFKSGIKMKGEKHLNVLI